MQVFDRIIDVRSAKFLLTDTPVSLLSETQIIAQNRGVGTANPESNLRRPRFLERLLFLWMPGEEWPGGDVLFRRKLKASHDLLRFIIFAAPGFSGATQTMNLGGRFHI